MSGVSVDRATRSAFRLSAISARWSARGVTRCLTDSRCAPRQAHAGPRPIIGIQIDLWPAQARLSGSCARHAERDGLCNAGWGWSASPPDGEPRQHLMAQACWTLYRERELAVSAAPHYGARYGQVRCRIPSSASFRALELARPRDASCRSCRHARTARASWSRVDWTASQLGQDLYV